MDYFCAIKQQQFISILNFHTMKVVGIFYAGGIFSAEMTDGLLTCIEGIENNLPAGFFQAVAPVSATTHEKNFSVTGYGKTVDVRPLGENVVIQKTETPKKQINTVGILPNFLREVGSSKGSDAANDDIFGANNW